MCRSLMETKSITKIALMACILFVAFTSLSGILYFEVITLVVVLFAMAFEWKEAFLASIVFAFLNMFVQGITIFSGMYLLIYPCYTTLVSSTKAHLIKHRVVLILLTAACSFATGMLLDLPFLLFSKKVTMLYFLLGFKTSLIQGTITGIMTSFIFDPLYQVLLRIERKSTI